MTPNMVVSSAVAILGAGLDAHISKVMEAKIGPLEWPVVLQEIDAMRGKVGYVYSRSDVAMQLRMITERLGALGYPFDEGDPNRTMSSYGGVLRIYRKRWAHNDEFNHFEAGHFLDAVRIVMMHIGDSARAAQVAELHAALVDELVDEESPAADVPEAHVKSVFEPQVVTTCRDMLPSLPEPKAQETLQPSHAASHEAAWEPWEVTVMGVQEDLDNLRKNAAKQTVRAIIEDIVDCEAPVQIDRLARLVGNAFGLKRVAKDRIKSIMNQIGRADVVKDADGFVWPKDVDRERWLLFRTGGAERKFDDVSPVELANAAVAVLATEDGMELEALRYAVIQIFGRKNATKGLVEHFAKGLAQALTFGRISETGGVYTLSADVRGTAHSSSNEAFVAAGLGGK